MKAVSFEDANDKRLVQFFGVFFLLWIFIIRRTDKNLILIFSPLRYAQTFSRR